MHKHHYLSLLLQLATLGLCIAILVKITREKFSIHPATQVGMHPIGEQFEIHPHMEVGGLVYEKFEIHPHLQEMRFSNEFAVQNNLIPAGVYCTQQESNGMGGQQTYQIVIKPDQTCDINMNSCCYDRKWVKFNQFTNIPFSVTSLGEGKYHIDIRNQDNGTFTLVNNYPVFQLGNYNGNYKGTYTYKSSNYNDPEICQ